MSYFGSVLGWFQGLRVTRLRRALIQPARAAMLGLRSHSGGAQEKYMAAFLAILWKLTH